MLFAIFTGGIGSAFYAEEIISFYWFMSHSDQSPASLVTPTDGLNEMGEKEQHFGGREKNRWIPWGIAWARANSKRRNPRVHEVTTRVGPTLTHALDV